MRRLELPGDLFPDVSEKLVNVWRPRGSKSWARPLVLLAQGRVEEARAALAAVPEPPHDHSRRRCGA